MKTISFTQSVKEELCNAEIESVRRKYALLSAYIRTNGTLRIRNKEENILLVCQNAKISKYIYKLLKELFLADVHIGFISKKGRRTTYQIEINKNAKEVLDKLCISFMEGKIPKEIVYDDDTIAGYLTGVFLSSGSVNSPKTSNYHLELVVNNENYLKWLSHLFPKYNHTNIEPKIIKRRDKYVLYFKKSDQIADFLLMIGAINSCMEYENIRIDRDYSNNTNRLINLDTANMSKTLEAGKRQQKEIKVLINKLGIAKLGAIKVQIVARLRLENDSYSLDDIAFRASEQLGKPVTKSNVNHILRRLHNLYLDLYEH